LNGSPTGTHYALLSTVRDVRSNTWTYHWYGQNNGESDSNQLDFETQFLSPSVDTTGSGTPNGPITRQSLTYNMVGPVVSGIDQVFGNNDLEIDWTFRPGGENITNEVTAGKTTVHR